MALPTSIELQIVRPDRLLVHEQVDEVEIPGSEGYFGVLPGHTPMLAALAIGEMWYRKGQEKTYLALAFGFAEVLPDRVTILARIAEIGHEIDIARAEDAFKRAQAQAIQKEHVDYEQARLDLMKAINRLQVASRLQLGGRVGHQRMPPPQG
jgi:F-type H+-transporting ATPase subunit epsilon